MADRPITRAFDAAVDRYLALHDKSCPELYPACWEFSTGGFDFALNAHGEPRIGGPHNGMRCELPAYTLGVWRNGWLAGMIDPYGGGLVNVSEQDVIAALESPVEPNPKPSQPTPSV